MANVSVSARRNNLRFCRDALQRERIEFVALGFLALCSRIRYKKRLFQDCIMRLTGIPGVFLVFSCATASGRPGELPMKARKPKKADVKKTVKGSRS